MPKPPEFRVFMAGDKQAVIEIYDEIGPSWAGMIDSKSVAAALKTAGDVDEIEVRINSIGGSAYDGIAIHNILKQHPANVRVRVDGVAISAASLIAMAGDEIEMPANALMMIHEPWTIAMGDEDNLLKAAEMLGKVNEAGIATYAARTGMKGEEIRQLLKDETWMTGEEAVSRGFATKLAGPVEVKSTAAVARQSFPFRKSENHFQSLVALSPRPSQKEEPTMADTNEAPATKEQSATPQAPAETAVPEPKQLTQADVDAAAKTAAKAAIAAENKRQSDIRAACKQASLPDLADGFCNDPEMSVEDVRQKLFDALCKVNRHPDDDPSEGEVQESGPDAGFKKEYAQQRAAYQSQGVSEEDYIAMRRVDEGLDILQPAG